MKKKLAVIIYIICFVISFLSCSQEGRIITDVPINEVDQTDNSNDVGEETDMEVSSLGEVYDFSEDTIIKSIQIKHASEPDKNKIINLSQNQSENLFSLLTDMNCNTLRLKDRITYKNLPEYVIHIEIERDGEIILYPFQFGESYLVYSIFASTSGEYSYNKHQINIDDYNLIKTFIE